MRAMVLVSVVSVGLLSGCSSIIEGTSQTLTINSDPAGAACKLDREGRTIARVSETPGSVVVEKTKHDIVVSCDKAGYQTATYHNKSGVAGATLGNIILGGGIGWAIDSASGADNKYTETMNISLVPVFDSVAPAMQPPMTPMPADPAARPTS